MQETEPDFEELQNLLSLQGCLGREIKEKIDLEQDKGITLLVVKTENTHCTIIEVIRLLSKAKQLGVYTSGRIPAEGIAEKLEGAKVSTKNLFFIDFAARRAKKMKKGKFYFVSGPKQITALEIILYKTIQKIPENKKAYLVFDSVSAMKAHHKKQDIEKFVHALSTKIRKKKKLAAFLLLVEEKGEKAFCTKISQYCDKTVFLGKSKAAKPI